MEDKVKWYLDRLEYSGGTEPTLENLRALQKAHFTHVPYENLDIYYGHEFTLAHEEVYDKIINRKRGGYCFELNGLYNWLLTRLGYRTEVYFARWCYGEKLDVPVRRHRIIKAFLPEGEFITDVGVGCQAPLEPLACRLDEPQEREGRKYRVVADAVHGKIVQVEDNSVWKNYFSFDEAPQQPIDFMYAHYWCTHHSNSPFINNLMVHIPTAYGRNSIASVMEPETGETMPLLSVSQLDGTSEKTFLYNSNQLLDALHTYFGIYYPIEAILR
ncbi:MAG: arylamine N-acetyltransferase [Victivallales bacterium]|nr:arylamine N-acetyltransferase [Victivallales bacterium]